MEQEFMGKMLVGLEEQKKFNKVVLEKLEEHDKKLDEHGKEISSIKDFLIVKEDELFNKIRALFDGYTISYEKDTEFESRQIFTEQFPKK